MRLRVEVVPHRKNAKPPDPSGLTVPFKVALLLVMEVAACVTDAVWRVVNLRTAPYW